MFTKGVLFFHHNVPVHKAHDAQITIRGHTCIMPPMAIISSDIWSPTSVEVDLPTRNWSKQLICGWRSNVQTYISGRDSLEEKWSKCIEVNEHKMEK